MSRSLENVRGFLAQVDARGGQEEAVIAGEFNDIRNRSAAWRGDSNFSMETGASKDNLKKNRYKDILPYDQTRVPLALLEEDGQTDYINANFIQGVDGRKGYIATQGPLAHTLLEFWRMIWQYHVKVIIMACREFENGKKKCERYWPLEQEPLQIGPFSVVQTREKQLNPDVLLRSMTVTFQRDTRTLSQFHYMAWPDRGIPDNTGHFLSMVEEARRTKGDDPAPLCVHCSAGCGRTGVICTVDYVRHLLLKQRIPPNFSIFDIVLEMRRQRPSAVQTQEQYKFVYHIVAEMFRVALDTTTPNSENLKEGRLLPLYDDALSLRPHRRQHPSPPCQPPNILRSISVPGEPVGPLPPTEPARGMNDTYAVVHKRGPPPPSSESKPREPQYDNVTAGGSAPAEVPLYSTVRSRGQRGASPEQAPPELRVPRPTNSLPGSPSHRPTPTTEYTQVNFPSPDSPSHCCPSPVSSNGSGKTLLRNLLPPVFTPSAGKRGGGSFSSPGTSGNPSSGAYEDIGEITARSNVTGLHPSNLGFNIRIGKPKGPRDPPAEWSRV
ncbi:tyrosine-protein phosphatase non-receptor type 18 isoform X2 [Ornithorhynchus anatinus]|uniref:tyrosine-protein phosphatase non-receptor type 18 isoform X2 n=1 Tax=Ornithorhynchus anatinus TaxID=9258 RepID=UPI0010A7CA79|nr:tyrosine-protein phosphatase non-receptor type 18 isoform X2 [Ornithorhynchus anatinus]